MSRETVISSIILTFEQRAFYTCAPGFVSKLIPKSLTEFALTVALSFVTSNVALSVGCLSCDVNAHLGSVGNAVILRD